MGTFAQGPAAFLMGLPFYSLGGAAFAYNSVVMLAFVFTYAGMYNFSRRLLTPVAAVLAACMYTFWGFRFFRIQGHINMVVGTALLPWLVWSLDRGLSASRRAWLWFVVAGAVWGFAIASTLYFVWIGGIIVAGWTVARLWSHQVTWRTAVAALFIAAITALAFSAPVLRAYLEASEWAGSSFHTLEHANGWGASINGLFVPHLYHPWLGGLAAKLYQGGRDEAGIANFGFATALAAAAALPWAWRQRTWRAPLLLALVGIVLGMGYTLKWNARAIQWDALSPLNTALWQLGYTLKPDTFDTLQPPYPFAAGVPLPGLLLAALVPFWEGARTLSRFAFVGALGFFPLAALGIQRLRWPWAQALLGVLVIIEMIPFVSGSVPYPPANHPAFEWLVSDAPSEAGVIDFVSINPDTLTIDISGEVLLATTYHRHPTVGGAGGTFPSHTVFLRAWTEAQPHPFLDPDFTALMRAYEVQYLLLHMRNGHEQTSLNDVAANPELRLVDCFSRPSQPTAWPYEICIIEVLPSPAPQLQTLFREGWSPREAWGIWAEGTTSRAQWIAIQPRAFQLTIEAFPICDPSRKQRVSVEVNSVEVGSYTWQECETWNGEMEIPGSIVNVGWNDVVLRSGFSASPFDITQGTASDGRSLSVGLNRLTIEEQ